MKTFAEILEEGDTEYSVSGHCIDTCMSVDEVLEYFRGKGMSVEDGVGYFGADGPGYKINEGNALYFDVYTPPQYPEDVEIDGLKTIITIHPGTGKGGYTLEDISECKMELMELMRHHVDNKIGAITYKIPAMEYDLHAVNRV